MFITTNKKIACKPSGKHSLEAPKVNRGLALPDERSKLFVVELIAEHFSSNAGLAWLKPGTLLFLPSDSFKHDWNRQVYKRNDGTEFILVPEDQVLAIEHPAETE